MSFYYNNGIDYFAKLDMFRLKFGTLSDEIFTYIGSIFF